MKILYLSGPEECNYLRDMLAHGLRNLLGPDFVDAPKLNSLYQSFNINSNTYGKGFTLYRLLPEIEVDRTDIEAKIKSRYYDMVIFGSTPRYKEEGLHFFLIGLVRDHYPASKIIYIDGEDDPLLYRELMDSGLYFKRELLNQIPGSFPIQFAIPEEKIVPEGTSVPKDMMLAPLNPWDPRTYIYNDEESYYRDYRRSLFGRTSKKCGWDCLRHYEIMACNCMPCFENLEACPPTVMMNLPKKELLIARELLKYKDGGIFLNDEGGFRIAGQFLWEDLMGTVLKQLRDHLTTKALALYVIDSVRKFSKESVETIDPRIKHAESPA